MRAMREPSPAWIASSSVVAVEARDVGDRLADRGERDLARGQQQCQLLDLLLGREEVALDAVGEPLERLHGGALSLPRKALGEPLGQLVARHGLRLHHTPAWSSASNQRDF